MKKRKSVKLRAPDPPSYLSPGFSRQFPAFCLMDREGRIKRAPLNGDKIHYATPGTHLMLCPVIDLSANPLLHKYLDLFVHGPSDHIYTWKELTDQMMLDLMSMYCAGRSRAVEVSRASSDFADWHLWCLIASIAMCKGSERRALLLKQIEQKLMVKNRLTREFCAYAVKALETDPDVINMIRKSTGPQTENPEL